MHASLALQVYLVASARLSWRQEMSDSSGCCARTARSILCARRSGGAITEYAKRPTNSNRKIPSSGLHLTNDRLGPREPALGRGRRTTSAPTGCTPAHGDALLHV